MDKSVIFAVAGSGKTTLLLDRLREDSRTLILTYTVNNEAHLRTGISKRFGYLPPGIRVMSWFDFLYGFCGRPLLTQPKGQRGLSFLLPPRGIPRTSLRHFQDSSGRLYHNRLALLLSVAKLMPAIKARLTRYYDELLIDEVQDIAGYDFDFLMALCATDIRILLAGDFYQHTFDTSRDGSKNAGLHDDFSRYVARFRAAGVEPDHKTLSHTWRCSATTCNFISTHLQISLGSYTSAETRIEIICDQESVAALHADDRVIKLFYASHDRYGCHSMNWGACKGLDHFQDVCIVMGASHWKLLRGEALNELATLTRNKLYVACSRARGNIWIVPETMMRPFRK